MHTSLFREEKSLISIKFAIIVCDIFELRCYLFIFKCILFHTCHHMHFQSFNQILCVVLCCTFARILLKTTPMGIMIIRIIIIIIVAPTLMEVHYFCKHFANFITSPLPISYYTLVYHEWCDHDANKQKPPALPSISSWRHQSEMQHVRISWIGLLRRKDKMSSAFTFDIPTVFYL